MSHGYIDENYTYTLITPRDNIKTISEVRNRQIKQIKFLWK